LESNIKGVFAGGDNAFAPILDTAACIGHWQLAQYHGRIAALNMVGKQTEVKTVPFFWTMLFGKGVRFAGMLISIAVNNEMNQARFMTKAQTDHRTCNFLYTVLIFAN